MRFTIIALATALLFTPVTAAEWINQTSTTATPSAEQIASSKKPKKTIDGETSDYLVVTLKDASVDKFEL